MTRFLDVDALLPQLERVGFKVKDPGLLGSALARPEMTIYGQDAYPTLWEKAAALFESIITTGSIFPFFLFTCLIIMYIGFKFLLKIFNFFNEIKSLKNFFHHLNLLVWHLSLLVFLIL